MIVVVVVVVVVVHPYELDGLWCSFPSTKHPSFDALPGRWQNCLPAGHQVAMSGMLVCFRVCGVGVRGPLEVSIPFTNTNFSS
eukprot:1780226-Pyramimonas_sp.AAC.1